MARIVLYDACVLYPAPLRDLLMRLALTDLFQARWTDQIHDEWTRNVLANRPDVTAESLARCRRLMDEHVPDCLVTGYESLIPTLSLPDPDDRHVLAAALHGGASSIITYKGTAQIGVKICSKSLGYDRNQGSKCLFYRALLSFRAD